MLNYQVILNKNLLNVLKDILTDIKKNGLSNGNHLYISFLTNHINVKIPNDLKDSYPKEMTIVIEHEYSGIKIYENFFLITLSFNNILKELKIGYDAVISFADPSANFGLRLQNNPSNLIKESDKEDKNNIIDFSRFKKN